MTQEEAVELARAALVRADLSFGELIAVKRKSGAERAKYIPSKVSDYWWIRFTAPEIPMRDVPGLILTEEQKDLLEALSRQREHVTVIVEDDGTTEIL